MDNLTYSEVIKLIENTFTFDKLWEAAVEVNQLCAARGMANKIPKNRDMGVEKDRVAVQGSNLLASLQELKGRDDKPVFVVSTFQSITSSRGYQGHSSCRACSYC